MAISILQNDNDYTEFLINNEKCNPSFINALRRILLVELSVIAIDDEKTEFVKNTCMLNSDILRQRLYLLPINNHYFDAKDISEITIEYNFKNEEEHIHTTYIKDFIIKYNDEIIDNTLIFPYPDMIFTKIKQNQEVIFKTGLCKNSSKEGGSPFNPTGTCFYKFIRDEDEIKKLTKDMKAEDKQSFELLGANRIYKKNKDGIPSVYNFIIEGTNVIKTSVLFEQACEKLIQKCSDLSGAINSPNQDKVKVYPSENEMNAFDFDFHDENDTMGNLITKYLHQNSNINFAGYLIPHPLNKQMIIRTSLNKKNTIEENIVVVKSTLGEIIALTKNILSDFRKSLKKN